MGDTGEDRYCSQRLGKGFIIKVFIIKVFIIFRVENRWRGSTVRERLDMQVQG
jgi:hypothetical protein